MHRESLQAALQEHQPWDAQEAEMHRQMSEFVRTVPDCFERSHLAGHVTGSAWIVSPDRDTMLLVLHRKLGLWLQPGGHADGNPDVQAVARQEALEETGLDVMPLSDAIYDVDVHLIPARKEVPAHLHYDVRFLFEGDPTATLTRNHESRELRWVRREELAGLNPDRSVLRLLEKMGAPSR